jgi:hypothetical protein
MHVRFQVLTAVNTKMTTFWDITLCSLLKVTDTILTELTGSLMVYYVLLYNAAKKVIMCWISSSHGGEYDVQSCLLGCTSVLNFFSQTDV